MQTVSIAELPGLRGHTFDASSWLVIEQECIDKFGEATHDLRWIHVDPVAAARGPFGSTIAHGYLTLSLIPHLMAELMKIDCRQTLNYGTEKIRFPSPVLSGSRIRLWLTIAEVQEVANGVQVGFRATVEREGADKPACVALLVCRFMN